ncbi:CBS domain-containing membrane protein [Paracoccus alkenifer]|uniref:CBS domain-containing membrane protein n=1 Tax=Paracoccus alkenifer TaxID=65735 RepID=A0A1H6LJK0_9RHOB|nr:CBS domain-containing membrane protein [Paracoccus alkenifer]
MPCPENPPRNGARAASKAFPARPDMFIAANQTIPDRRSAVKPHAPILRAFGPVLPQVRPRELFRAAAGGAIGIGICTLLALALPQAFGLPLMLMAPLGASAVLIFAVPNAPLAQPWSAVVGNMISAVVAVLVLRHVPAPLVPAMAVSGAILGMLLLRALHPPGGAIALLTALDPAPALQLGFLYPLAPVGIMTALLVVVGILYDRCTGRRYPFRQPKGADAPPPSLLPLSTEELAALLRRFNQSPNIGVADLGRILAAAEQEIANHRFDAVTCAQIMTSRLITAGPEDPIAAVAGLFRSHPIKSIPVVDASGAALGIILQADVIRWLTAPGLSIANVRGRHRITARQMMRAADGAVAEDLPVGHLLHRLANQGGEAIPVVSPDGRLAGIITRSDIMRLLLHDNTRRAAA